MTLQRRTPLARGEGLKRGKPLARGKGLARGGRVKPISDKRRADLPRRAAVRAKVLARDRGCLLAGVPDAGPCMGRLEMHERLKASQGTDTYTEENGATLCSSHNGRIEADADLAALARSRGLVIRRADLTQGGTDER